MTGRNGFGLVGCFGVIVLGFVVLGIASALSESFTETRERAGSVEMVVPGESVMTRAASPICVPVVNPILIEELNATQAVRRTFDPASPEALRLPERMRFTVGWLVASPTGGLWLSYMPAENSSPNGIIMALNDQARTESTVGTAGTPDAPGYQGVTAADTEAVMALACAQGSF